MTDRLVGSSGQASWRIRSPAAVFQPRPGLGDLIWHLSLIRALAAAAEDSRVTLILKPSTQADTLLAGDPCVERILWFDRQPRGGGSGRHDGPLGFPRLVADLRRAGLQSCILLHHGLSLAAAMALAGIPHRYGYGYGLQRWCLNRPPFLPKPPAWTDAFGQAMAYGNAVGLPNAAEEPFLRVPPRGRKALPARLEGWKRPIAVLAIGSTDRIRQWPPELFAELACALLGRGIGAVALVGVEAERALAARIIAIACDAARLRPVVDWPLDQVTALLDAADIFIGNDSGLLNLRAALGRPAYGLFGASGPLSHSRMIRAIIPAQGARSGMDRIRPRDVLAALDGAEREAV